MMKTTNVPIRDTIASTPNVTRLVLSDFNLILVKNISTFIIKYYKKSTCNKFSTIENEINK